MTLQIFGTSVQGLIDTGADACGISKSMIETNPRYLRYIYRKTPRICISVNKIPLRSEVSLMLPIHIGGRIYHHEFHVINNLEPKSCPNLTIYY